MDDEIYNSIKQSATSFPKGAIKVVSLKTQKEEIVYSRDAMGTIIENLISQECPYVVLDYFDKELLLAIDGYTYMKKENLTTGKLLYYRANHRSNIDIAQLKNEIEKLHITLRNSKAS